MNQEVFAKFSLQHAFGKFPIECTLKLGQLTAVIGNKSQGQQELLDALQDGKQPFTSVATDSCSTSELRFVSKRMSLQNWVSKKVKLQDSLSLDDVANLMATLGLWAHRKESLARILQSREAELRIISALLSPCLIVILEGVIDQLDPCAQQLLLQKINQAECWGKAILFDTFSTFAARQCDQLLVMKASASAFCGSPQELESAQSEDFEVYSENQPAVAQILGRLQVEVEADGRSCYRFSTPHGQDVTARLLVEGYGDVSFFVRRRPTFEEALIRLLSRTS